MSLSLNDTYAEWVEDLGLSPVEILTVLLDKERNLNSELQKENSDLRNRMAKYEH